MTTLLYGCTAFYTHPDETEPMEFSFYVPRLGIPTLSLRYCASYALVAQAKLVPFAYPVHEMSLETVSYNGEISTMVGGY